jgi:GxxExxY protein
VAGVMALLHEDVTGPVLKTFYDVYGEMGQGFLESVCQAAMLIALRASTLSVVQFARLGVHFRGHIIGDFVPDMIVNGCVIVEIKSGRAISPAHEAQLINYLRASEIEVGLLLNFGPRPEYIRRILTNDRKIPTRAPLPAELR